MIHQLQNEELQSDPKLHWSLVRHELFRAGYTQQSLAEELGITKQTVNKVKDTHLPRIERAIAEKIGVAPEVIWQNRYLNKRKKPSIVGTKIKRNKASLDLSSHNSSKLIKNLAKGEAA